MTQGTHSLAMVAENYLPAEWSDGVRWLSRRLNRGELQGVRFGRVWRMRDSDIDFMLDRYSNNHGQSVVDRQHPIPDVPESVADGLSRRSRRRLRSAS